MEPCKKCTGHMRLEFSWPIVDKQFIKEFACPNKCTRVFITIKESEKHGKTEG